MTRPTKKSRPRTGPRSASVLIWLTPEERTRFKAAAAEAGLGLGPWIRTVATSAARAVEMRRREAGR